MSTKLNRLHFLKKIIQEGNIEKQEMLLNKLKHKGFVITQATLSRDLKELKVSKILNNNNVYVYTLPNAILKNEINQYKKYSLLGFYSIEASGNIAVIKTKSGYANSLASKIDELYIHEIIGTIAGDDTIMLVINENYNLQDLKKALIINIPELKDFIKL